VNVALPGSLGLVTRLRSGLDCSNFELFCPRREENSVLLGAISLVHVVDPTDYNGMQLYVRPISEVLEEFMGIGRERLNSFLAAEIPAAECPRILASGGARYKERANKSLQERGRAEVHNGRNVSWII
jgi:hypothetical protein